MRKADHELQNAPDREQGGRAPEAPGKRGRDGRAGRAGDGGRRSPSPARKTAQASGAPRLRGRGSLRLEPELTAEFAAIAAAAGCELVHAELRGNVLRILLDRADGGVTLNDCELISKHVSAFLDVVDFGKGRYVLEVGSPGLDRQLYGPRDYRRFTGSLVRVTLEPPGGRKRTVVGRLLSFREEGEGGGTLPGALIIALEKDGAPTGEELQIGLDTIKLARLEIEL